MNDNDPAIPNNNLFDYYSPGLFACSSIIEDVRLESLIRKLIPNQPKRNTIAAPDTDSNSSSSPVDDTKKLDSPADDSSRTTNLRNCSSSLNLVALVEPARDPVQNNSLKNMPLHPITSSRPFSLDLPTSNSPSHSINSRRQFVPLPGQDPHHEQSESEYINSLFGEGK